MSVSGYYVNRANRERIFASLDAVFGFTRVLYDSVESDDFNPTEFLAMLENVEGEVAFLRQYVTYQFLTKDTSDESKPEESFE